VSLTGLTVAITGSRRGSELARIVKNLGGRPYVAPTVGIEADLKTPDNAIVEFIKSITKQDVDYMIFMTGPGVFALMSIAKTYEMEQDLIAALQKVTVVARSTKSKMVLKKYGIKTHLIPSENTAKGILNLLKNLGLLGKTIGILWHGGYHMQLREELYMAGAVNVMEAATYQYSFEINDDGASILMSMGFNYVVPKLGTVIQLIENIIAGRIDIITFTSPPSVHGLFKIANINHTIGPLRDSLNTNVIVAAVGPSTEEALKENKVIVDVIPQTYNMGAMVKAISDYTSLEDLKKKQQNKDHRIYSLHKLERFG
jgi:uroporphyrinogen-III synthase